MYTLKNNKLPKLHLKLNGYKIEYKSDKVIQFTKTVVEKDKYHYGFFYHIHIFHYIQDGYTEICVVKQSYVPQWEDWGFVWYSGDYQDQAIPIIEKYDKKLLKYIEKISD